MPQTSHISYSSTFLLDIWTKLSLFINWVRPFPWSKVCGARLEYKLFQYGPMESQPILVIRWLPGREAHADRFMVLGLPGNCYTVTGQLGLSVHANEVLRGWGLEGVPHMVGGLSSHHLHHHHHHHDQSFLEEGNLGLSISRRRQQTKLGGARCEGAPGWKPAGYPQMQSSTKQRVGVQRSLHSKQVQRLRKKHLPLAST